MDYTKEELEALKKEYESAVKDGYKVFIFQDREFDIEYAKHLIEYLEILLTPVKPRDSK